MTLRKTFIKSATDELLWIWQKKSNNINDFKGHVWDAWANEDGSEVLRGESWITNAYENLAFVTLGTIPHFTYLLPDTTDTVLAIEYKEDPQ